MSKFKNNEKGQGLVEYALILVLLAIVVIVAMRTMGNKVSGTIDDVNDEMGGGAVVVTATLTQTPVPTWQNCAAENDYCSFSGTKQVRYGANDSWFTQTHTDGVACRNAVFGDPIYGVVKSCEVLQ